MKKVLFMLLVMFALSACQSKDSLNADEKAEIIKLQATYAGLKMKAGVKDAAKKVDKFLDGLKEGTK